MSHRSGTSSLQSFSGELSALVEKAESGIVSIRGPRMQTSGFLWKPGLVVTAEEALAEEGPFQVVLPGGETATAALAGRDPTTDVALLRLESQVGTPVALASPTLAAGQLAVAIGAVDGAPLAHFGMVAQAGPAWRSMRGGEIDARIELDMRLRRAGEGGLVLDAAGDAFGMAVFGPRRRVLVIPSATIERVAAALERNGRIPRGYLGVGLQPVALQGGEGQGAMVISVDPKGPAVAAGLHQGDIIVSWDDEPVRHMRRIMRHLGPESVGRTVALGIRRAGETRSLPLTIAERPEA